VQGCGEMVLSVEGVGSVGRCGGVFAMAWVMVEHVLARGVVCFGGWWIGMVAWGWWVSCIEGRSCCGWRCVGWVC